MRRRLRLLLANHGHLLSEHPARTALVAASAPKNVLAFASQGTALVYYGQMQINPYLLFVVRVFLFQALVALAWYYVVTRLP